MKVYFHDGETSLKNQRLFIVIFQYLLGFLKHWG